MRDIIKKILFTAIVFIGLIPILRAQNHDQLKLRLDASAFSPDGNGLQDVMFFYPVITTNQTVTSWRLDIEDSRGKRVQRITGSTLTGLVKWDGLDKKGDAAPDGTYSANYEAWTRDGHIAADTVVFRLDRVAPTVSLGVSTTTLDQVTDTEAVLRFYPSAADASGISLSQLQVMDKTGRTVFIHWSTATITELVWDARDKSTGVLVPEGSYHAVFEAWDAGGNESVPATVDIAVRITPSQILQNVLSNIRVYETPLGLICPLLAKDIFDSRRGRPEISKAGQERLKEAALLINAYPNLPVRVDGYSGLSKKGGANADQSSVYAWSVFSFLVKEGHVTPARMRVHGRGRSPLFDRRATEPAVLKDGVEIVLEGQQKW